jgi:glycosyltransferase involved in cell wall biosynthesis
MDISVIIPCRNEERHVAHCLESLLAQRYPEDRYEILLADNMSTDRTVEIARRYPRVTVVREEKLSSYAARNAAARIATGHILAFTDADCEAAPDWLATIVDALRDERTALVLGSRRFAHEGFVLRSLADYETEKARFVYAQNDPRLYYAYTNNLAVRREAFDRCGPFVEIARGGDVVFASRVLAAYGCDALRFLEPMRIRHLEIDRWYGWHHKMWIYGQSYERYHTLSGTRPLDFRERFQVLWQAAKKAHKPWLQAPLLLLSGMAAGLAFEAGRRRARR